MSLIAAILNSAVSANKNHLGLFNTAGQYPLEICRMEVAARLDAAVTGTGLSLNILRTTAAGTASAATIRKTDLRETVPASVTAGHTFTVAPTITANSELATLTVSSEESGNAVSAPGVWQANSGCGIDPIIVDAGGGIVIQQLALASAGEVDVYIWFRIRKEKRNGV